MSKTSVKYLLRKRIKLFAIIVVISSLVFICYQLLYFKQLDNQLHDVSRPVLLIRGIHQHQIHFYMPKDSNKFTCIQSGEILDFSHVNDDYCDCKDGSDEPGTNACSNGYFFCLHQDLSGKFKKHIPASMVNDGICDCCDGSDEWGAETLAFRLSDLLQKRLGRYQTPCINYCSA